MQEQGRKSPRHKFSQSNSVIIKAQQPQSSKMSSVIKLENSWQTHTITGVQSSVVSGFLLPHPVIKTSLTHPLIISEIIDESLWQNLNGGESIQMATSSSSRKRIAQSEGDLADDTDKSRETLRNHSRYGKFALCSLPGKKVRLNGATGKMKSPISRDLDADFSRIATLGYNCIVNLLSDDELLKLNAPIDEYLRLAQRHNIEILRYPIVEGLAPDDLQDFKTKVTDDVVGRLKHGQNVLCHCRGGIGRAGLVACCLLLQLEMCQSATEAIALVRAKRSSRAIETIMQEDFIDAYHESILLQMMQRVID
ncbi:hypothetical protein MIR68_011079 [Amoeboaphelidium protococcarum]|nr:hypothetical protein MIR68_011079 [Amoeboaphelidium protococcarum]